MERLEARWNISRSFCALVGHHLMQVQTVSVHLSSLWNNMILQSIWTKYREEMLLSLTLSRFSALTNRNGFYLSFRNGAKKSTTGFTITIGLRITKRSRRGSRSSLYFSLYGAPFVPQYGNLMIYYHACQTSWIIRKLKYFEVGAYMYRRLFLWVAHRNSVHCLGIWSWSDRHPVKEHGRHSTRYNYASSGSITSMGRTCHARP
ncbi:hypothetical protein V8F33_000471 [Rhypophila sp. PSN 637]